MNDIDNAIRKSGLTGQLDEHHASARVLLGRLDQARIAARGRQREHLE